MELTATSSEVRVLLDEDQPALKGLLLAHPSETLFMLGVLEGGGPRGVRGGTEHRFYGLWRGGSLRAAAFVAGSGQLVVPHVPEPEDAWELARGLLGQVRPARLVGERLACDALRDVLVPAVSRPRVLTRSRLYGLEPGDLRPQPGIPGLRVAVSGDLSRVVPLAVAMHKEDLGEDPLRLDADAYVRHVGVRVASGRVWVVEEADRLVFKVDLGTWCRHGAQLEGVYTVLDRRGRGVATRALGALCARLLAEVPRVTLHVREDNAPAVAVYERLGFRPLRPFRIFFA